MLQQCVELVGHAGVSGVAPIQTGSFATVFVEDQLWLAEGERLIVLFDYYII